MPISTFHWSPGESSLLRSSLNSTVLHQEFDVPGSLMTDSKMGQAAMMGEGWVPGGLAGRQASQAATSPKPGAAANLAFSFPSRGLGLGERSAGNSRTTTPLASGRSACSPMRSPSFAPGGCGGRGGASSTLAMGKTNWASMLKGTNRSRDETDIATLKMRHGIL
eukprot:TRINITY_DN89786_c0_g1_i1.p1 TRINITY_DN89786_c0_g1~~TRINITY_DN89786_c0_g1_i1.p1  ORF type:complete len:182 (+),score=26.48 TRINITY_DN89786_c0_g1_i1:52-546(+)